jgi:hypothetical protein
MATATPNSIARWLIPRIILYAVLIALWWQYRWYWLLVPFVLFTAIGIWSALRK